MNTPNSLKMGVQCTQIPKDVMMRKVCFWWRRMSWAADACPHKSLAGSNIGRFFKFLLVINFMNSVENVNIVLC